MQILETINHKYLWSTYCAQGTLLRKSKHLLYQRLLTTHGKSSYSAWLCIIVQKSFTAHASAVEGMPPPTPYGHLPHPSTKEAGHPRDVTEMVKSGGGRGRSLSNEGLCRIREGTGTVDDSLKEHGQNLQKQISAVQGLLLTLYASPLLSVLAPRCSILMVASHPGQPRHTC